MAHNNEETGDGGGQQERQTELVLHSGQDRIGTKSTKLNTFKNKAFIYSNSAFIYKMRYFSAFIYKMR